MIKGQIIIKLSDGSIVTYANRFLADKEGDDGLQPLPNLKFPGFPGTSYYYTGQGDDTYENQNLPGMIKSDYEYLISQMDTVTEQGVLIFPENDKKAVPSPVVGPSKEEPANEDAGTDVLVRRMMSTLNSGLTFSRTKIFLNEIVSINIIEDWVDFPYGIESGYQLPKTSPNFYGFAESKERKAKGEDRGPDFNKYWTTDNGYIPRPILELGDKNELIVKNEEEFNKIVSKKFSEGYEVYGVREYKDEYGNVKKFKNSGTVIAYNHPIRYVIKRIVNNSSISEIKDDVIKVEEGHKINYGEFEDTAAYFFDYWSLDEEGAQKELPEFADKDLTIYAQWRDNPNLSCTYADLDKTIASLKPEKEYNLTIDTTGVSETEFKGTGLSNQSPFGKKIANSKSDKLNLTFDLPDTVTDASYMLVSNTKVKSVNVTKANNLTTAEYMFSDCKGLTSIDTTAFTNVTNASLMFYYCTGLTSIDTAAFTNVTNARSMFYYCTGLTSIDTSAFTQVNDACFMFSGCTGLTSIDTSAFTQVNDASHMFDGCTGLTSITGTTAFEKVKNVYYMFNGCSGLTSIDTAAFTNVTNAEAMFQNCTGLTEINWGNIKPATVTNMFNGASAQKTITVADAETQQWIETNKATMKLDDKYTINVLQQTVDPVPADPTVTEETPTEQPVKAPVETHTEEPTVKTVKSKKAAPKKTVTKE